MKRKIKIKFLQELGGRDDENAFQLNPFVSGETKREHR